MEEGSLLNNIQFKGRFYRPFLLVLCAALVMVTGVSAQFDPYTTYSDGFVKVFESELKEPLPGVVIFKSDLTFSITTDAYGRADIRELSKSDTLSFELVGYKTTSYTVQEIENSDWIVYLDPDVQSLGEIVVTGPTKTPERSREVPSMVDVVDSEDIAFANPQTAADMLATTGNIFVQKSQMGGGSPIIRGFEANKVLIVLDGVRMNNAIYRNGHLQNVITIDNSVLERTEVIYGPASVIYGSDALGGVMHFTTKKPKLKTENLKAFTTGAYFRFSSANREKTAHLDISYGDERWATLSSVTYSNYDHLRSGKNKHKDYPLFGDRMFYTERIGKVDSVLMNPDPHIQIGTDYNQLDLLQKIRFQPKDSLEFIANIQYSTTSDVPRYDQLTQGSLVWEGSRIVSKEFKFSEWYYGPQSRLFASIRSNIRSASDMFDHASIILAYQNIDEDRITRRFGQEWRTIQEENVDVISFNADFIKSVKDRHKLLYGLEFTHNRVNSLAFRESVETFEKDDRVQTRYPDGGSTMIGTGAYLSFQTKFGSRKQLNFISGLRYSFITLTSNFVDTSFFQLPETKIVLDTRSLTGSVGLTWDAGKGFNVHTVLSSAFRAPNVDDFGKVRSKNGYVLVPNPDLVSEKSYNAEISISKKLSNKVRVNGTFFYTYLFDAIIRETCAVSDGGGSIEDCLFYYNGNFDTLQFNSNTGEALIYGLSGNVLVELRPDLILKGGINYTYGQDISDDSPLPHIPPLYGQISLDYKFRKLAEFKLVSNFNGWKRVSRYASLDSSDNLDLATEDGTYSWYTINFLSALNFKYGQVTFGVENILDKHYRLFSSGISAPGRNFTIGVRGQF